jgi:hypothetical protein
VTIRTKEAEVPSEFPPARLFLDDIEEIVRVLVDANKDSNPLAHQNEDAKTKITFTIKDQVCDEIDELPKIAKKTTELSIMLEWESGLAANSLTFYRDSSSLGSYLLSSEGHLSLFHKLAPIFKRRNRRFAMLVRSSRPILLTLVVLLLLPVTTIIYVPSMRTPSMLILAIVTGLLSTAIFITVLAARSHHTIIIMRHSSEPSALRQELLHKVPVAAVSSVLTFLLTLLGLYLKHKYWP